MRTCDAAYRGMLQWMMLADYVQYTDSGLWDFLQQEWEHAQ